MSQAKVVRTKEKATTRLGDLQPGECFIYNEEVYYRLASSSRQGSWACVRLTGPNAGHVIDFTCNTPVIPTDATITVEG